MKNSFKNALNVPNISIPFRDENISSNIGKLNCGGDTNDGTMKKFGSKSQEKRIILGNIQPVVKSNVRITRSNNKKNSRN